MKDVLVICPQARDLRLARSDGYRVRLAGPDLDAVDVDVDTLLEELAAEPADGVVGTKDRSALVAALLAERRGLPGPKPAAIVSCQHKPTSREIQRRVAADSTPRFALPGASPAFPGPWWAKPVVGRLSQEARRVEDGAALAALAEEPDYRDAYAELAGLSRDDVRGFLVEELLAGDEVTLEGFVRGGGVTTIGVTDSVKYPRTNSFERFEYPSALPPDRLGELDELARTLVPAHGLDDCFFNIEFFVPATGPAKIVELNPRIASQFAPLVEAVHGRSTYDVLFAVACGDDPRWAGDGPRGVAISYVVRVFEDAFVAGVPDREDGLEILVRPGLRLSEQGANDTASYRLALFTEWGETREDAVRRCRERARALRFELGRGAPRR
ncbi:MAG TPA: ATP-grasp domain-containing protein [Gaiellaceae bacterium]|nr:ATP-grasp domain-containing protein [Gaiellaceae bacterium]